MSWHYSQALAAAYSAATSSGGAPSAPSRSIPTPQPSLPPGKMTARSRRSRFGMMFAPLTDDRGEALLTWFREVSLARTSPPQARESASTANAPDSGARCVELSARYDLGMHSWRIHPCLWVEALPESSVTLPKSGMMRRGVCWELTTWAPRISASASGYLHMIPTPTTHGLDGGSNSRRSAKERGMWPTPRANKTTSESAESWLDRHRQGKVATPPLALAVKFAPPQSRDYRSGEAHRWDNPQRSRNLNDQIAKYPTPQVADATKYGCMTASERMARGRQVMLHNYLSTETCRVGGQLNPTWVEWLMGWPLAWTDLEPLATDRFRSWLRLHSAALQAF